MTKSMWVEINILSSIAISLTAFLCMILIRNVIPEDCNGTIPVDDFLAGCRACFQELKF